MYGGSGQAIELPGTKRIRVDLDKCVECRRCELACSFAYGRRYNPMGQDSGKGPYLTINRSYKKYISFHEACVDCDICVRACFFGALTFRESQS